MVIVAGAVMLLSTPLTALYTTLGLSMNPSRWKRFLPLYILTVFMLSHAFTPKIESLDLVKYFAFTEDIAKSSSIRDVLVYSKDGDDGLFVKNILFWIAGILKDPHLLPAISNSIVYGISAYIIMDTAERENMVRLIPYAIVLQLLALPFTSITSNVRNICAFSLVVLAAYQNMVKGKHGVGILLLYVLPCFLHFSSVVILLCRLIVGLTKRHKRAGLLGLLALLLFPALLKLAYNYLSLFSLGGSLGRMLQYGIAKTYSYFDTETLSIYEIHTMNSVGNAIQKLIMMLTAVIVFVQGYWYLKYVKDRRNDSLCGFLLLLCAMVVACRVFIAPHYWRFYCAMMITSPAALFPMWRNRKMIPPLLHAMLYLVPVLACGVFALDFRRFIISVDLPAFFAGSMLDNLYSIIFGALRSLI